MRNLSLSGDPTIWYVFGVMAVCLEQIVSAVGTLWYGVRSEQDILLLVGLATLWRWGLLAAMPMLALSESEHFQPSTNCRWLVNRLHFVAGWPAARVPPGRLSDTPLFRN